MKEIIESSINDIFAKYKLDIQVNDIQFYKKAFVHKSSCINESDSYERQEFLGDCILGSIVGSYLFERFPDAQEGFLTKTRTKIVQGRMLSKLAKKIGLGDYAIVNNTEHDSIRTNSNLLEDLFESFVGAIYLDNGGESLYLSLSDKLEKYKDIEVQICKIEEELSNNVLDRLEQYLDLNRHMRVMANAFIHSNGYLLCQKFIIKIIESEISMARLIMVNDNYKDILQQHYQKVHKVTPQWIQTAEMIENNKKVFQMSVFDHEMNIIGSGKSSKKIDASQKASKEALIVLGLLEKSVFSDDDSDDEN